ncbi:MAG: hypothetical protein U0930_13605 [Pirellulales bacterium]
MGSQSQSKKMDRRLAIATGFGAIAVAATGCVPQTDGQRPPNLVWGQMGFSEGRFQKARAITISPIDEMYIVDKMGRIQVFDTDGNFKRTWSTPLVEQGKPVGLAWSNDDLLIVADTHYFRVLFYTPAGELVESRTIGGELGDAQVSSLLLPMWCKTSAVTI